MLEHAQEPDANRVDPLKGVNIGTPEMIRDPFPTFRALQQNHPVAWNEQLKGWIVTRFDDVDRVLRDPHTSVEKLGPFVDRSSEEDRPAIEFLAEVLGDWMLFADPPQHTELRRALKDAFMPAEIKALEPRVRATVDRLLDELPLETPVDWVEGFAYPLPAMVIGELFGLPREELEDLKRWSDPLGRLVLASTERENLYSNAAKAVREMCDRFMTLVAEHRKQPRDNFTSQMIANAEHLTDEQIVHNLVLVLWAGHDTTTNHLATAVHYLCARPDLFQVLRDDPALIPGTVEEFLRLDSPAHMLMRLAQRDMELSGQTIRAGDRIFLMMNTANRDDAKFDAPDDLQPERKKNRHLSFGKGIHVCLGAPLARLEGVQALTAICERYCDIQFAGDPVTWRPNLIMRGPDYLQVKLFPA